MGRLSTLSILAVLLFAVPAKAPACEKFGALAPSTLQSLAIAKAELAGLLWEKSGLSAPADSALRSLLDANIQEKIAAIEALQKRPLEPAEMRALVEKGEKEAGRNEKDRAQKEARARESELTKWGFEFEPLRRLLPKTTDHLSSAPPIIDEAGVPWFHYRRYDSPDSEGLVNLATNRHYPLPTVQQRRFYLKPGGGLIEVHVDKAWWDDPVLQIHDLSKAKPEKPIRLSKLLPDIPVSTQSTVWEALPFRDANGDLRISLAIFTFKPNLMRRYELDPATGTLTETSAPEKHRSYMLGQASQTAVTYDLPKSSKYKPLTNNDAFSIRALGGKQSFNIPLKRSDGGFWRVHSEGPNDLAAFILDKTTETTIFDLKNPTKPLGTWTTGFETVAKVVGKPDAFIAISGIDKSNRSIFAFQWLDGSRPLAVDVAGTLTGQGAYFEIKGEPHYLAVVVDEHQQESLRTINLRTKELQGIYPTIDGLKFQTLVKQPNGDLVAVFATKDHNFQSVRIYRHPR